MKTLRNVPYRLYARQPDTAAGTGLNCFTAVIEALRKAGRSCPDMNIHQGLAFWWPRAQRLQLGQTPIAGQDVLLLTRSHFMLLRADRNANQRIDADDLIAHAYYRRVEINTINDWLHEAGPQNLRYLPVDDSFLCPSASALRQLKRSRSG
ncbi:hypothetical protein Q9Q94_06925 [Uliginosibacterium sp. 31-16]|uniref:hypothetical protein n=1 Tax=Uliginosibacterium sp. 31-16 TaxID=3068315 RepID=UPI00273F3599|nr:hypothetical protein [Uliginosibacterium sp. 31-16]MDP5239255.1 hypothetical protein [Uliginosibacterium sp. 31-16]